MHEWIAVLLSHELELFLKSSVSVTRDEAHMCQSTDFLRSLATAFLIALQKAAELLVVLALLLLDGDNILECLLKVHQVQVQVGLVFGELGDLFTEDCDITILKVLFNMQV